ncbi:MAG TPA: sucrase ferredoxin [Propionibacteriaceae bacterium]|nr:sucrase ferredoxin [Propionibacteriaceae bacterium]
MRCSAASLVRQEPLAGTAPVATRFLVVEYPGHWPSEPLDAFGAEARGWLKAATKAVHGQVLLVRRPGAPLLEPEAIRDLPLRWWVVDTDSRTQIDGSWTAEADLAAAASVLNGGAASDQPAPPPASRGESPTARPAELALLVCCHAKRDQCCAIEGRPLAAALAERWPEATWQCTHLGGHRFAPTFLVLPDGVCYGRVPAGEGPEVVAGQLEGRVRADLLRGYCSQEGWEQAAVAHVLAVRQAGVGAALRQAQGPRSGRVPDGLAREEVAPGKVIPPVAGLAVTSRSLEPDVWTVTVTVGGAPYDVVVRAVHHPPVPLSCGDAPAKKSVSYIVAEGKRGS